MGQSYNQLEPGLSNYGQYIVMQHEIDRLAVYTLYAHLRKMAPDLRLGPF
ncbi:MAG: hypothetical protein CM1200mP29_11820 [Verrucomicrobiota bacterium]|nr:MAG: hypothetical protein CM1200mP29_11820 [Verrucomicrobiota bacterium]